MNQKQLTKRSVEQLVEVLKGIQAKWSINKDINHAYTSAVLKVANLERVERATIADLCTRRLGLNTEQFKAQAERWLRGDSSDLYNTIKKHAANYLSFDHFFGSQTESKDGFDTATTTSFQIELDPSISSVVTKLSNLSGTSPEKLISQYLNTNFRQYLIDLLSAD